MATTGAQPGNQNAAKGKRCREALIKALALSGKGDADAGLFKIMKKVVKLANEGEQWATQEIFNRMDGRVPAAVEVSGANGGELVIRDATRSMGVARRVAFVLAQGALSKANESAKATEEG